MPIYQTNPGEPAANGHSEGDFEAIFKKYFPALKGYAQLFVQEQIAEDLVQDILVYIWENKANLHIHTSLEAYLFKSVYQRCLSEIKRQNTVNKHHSRLELDLRLEEMSYFDADQNESIRRLFMDDLQLEIENAIESLPPKCREVFELSYLHDQKNKDISQKLDISVNTVENHISKALRLLREKISRFIPLLFFLLH